MTNYILLWIDEEESWYYFIDDFNEDDFPDGYVDYYVSVDDEGIIVSCDPYPDMVGKNFDKCFDLNYMKTISKEGVRI